MSKFRRSVNRGGSQLNRVMYKFEDNLNDSGALGDDLDPNTGNTHWFYKSNGLSGKWLKYDGWGRFHNSLVPDFQLADERGDCPFSVTMAFKKTNTSANPSNGWLLCWGSSGSKLRAGVRHDNGVISVGVYTGSGVNNTNNYLKAELTASGTNILNDFNVDDWIIIQVRYSGQGKWKSDSLEIIMNKTYSAKSTETGTYEGMDHFGQSGSLATVFSMGADRYGGSMFRWTGFDSVIFHEGDLLESELDDVHDDVLNGNTINLLA